MARGLEADRLVFVEEMGTNASLVPLLYAWSRRGERAFASVAHNWGAKDVTLLASMSAAEGMGPCLVVEGSTTRREVFEAYLEGVLLPSLRPGQR